MHRSAVRRGLPTLWRAKLRHGRGRYARRETELAKKCRRKLQVFVLKLGRSLTCRAECFTWETLTDSNVAEIEFPLVDTNSIL